MTISWGAVDWPLALILIYLLLPILAVTAIYFSDKSSAEQKKEYLKLLKNVISLCLGFTLFMVSMLIYPALGPWEEATRGVYDHVEYTDTRVKKVPLGWRTVHKTIIYFTDGRTYIMPGEYSLTFERSTVIRILTKNSHYKIEVVTN